MTRFITKVDPSGLFSKLPGQIYGMYEVHTSIRARTVATPPNRSDARKRIALSEDQLLAAEKRYLAGETLRTVASTLGIGRPRLASLFRERGLRVRRLSPTDAEVNEMIYRYERGESLARIGTKLGFHANTIRTRLLEHGIETRDTHGRER
ncbi:MAG: hypothetical protein KF742_07920 [Cryobacterium sp.]|nr:hypothetical protein [Cryobacterium sp.]